MLANGIHNAVQMTPEVIRVSGIEVTIQPNGDVLSGVQHLGSVKREQRMGEWFWRPFPADGEPCKRFLTARHEAIQVLLLRSDLVGGIGVLIPRDRVHTRKHLLQPLYDLIW